MNLYLSHPLRFSGLPCTPSTSRSRSSSNLRFSCSAPFYPKFRRPYTSVLIVPTGVGASIGGFAGDALPVARTLASVVDCLISHPNVLNAAMLYWPMSNVLYVEGYALDRFAEGSWVLQPVHQNKVGLVLDAGIEEELRIRHLQVADATRASLGLPVMEYIVTDTPLEIKKLVWRLEFWAFDGKDTLRLALGVARFQICRDFRSKDICFESFGIKHLQNQAQLQLSYDFLSPQVQKWIDPSSGQSTGRIKSPDSLLRAVQTLVKQSQVNAVAVVGRFPDDNLEEIEDYRQGKGVDLLAGVEAVISHLVVREFQIPCAHAPALSLVPLSPVISPRSAAEEIGYTFLPCVLAGLSHAPQYLVNHQDSHNGCIVASDVDSIILPIDACGGDGALAFARNFKNNKPLIIAVQENETVLDDTPDKLGIEAVKVLNYWEAIGVIAAHKAGVDPEALRREGINNIRCHSTSTSCKPSFTSSMYDRVYST